MLDIHFVRENPEKVKQAIAQKNDKADVDALLERDKTRRELIKEVEALKHQRNQASRLFSGIVFSIL